MSDSLQALRNANPRTTPGYTQTIEAVVATVSADVLARADANGASGAGLGIHPRRVLVSSLAAAVSLALVVSVAGPLSHRGHRRESRPSTMNVLLAATKTAASADQSGTAEVSITHGAEPWSGATIQWNGADLDVAQSGASRPHNVRRELLLVGGTMYAPSAEGAGWVILGSPSSIDPGSGTTPEDYLTAVRDDVGGGTLRRITAAMNGVVSDHLADGSTVFHGTVAAAVLAPRTDVKDGQEIRVFPFGYVAHDEAANPSSQIDTAITVGPDGVIRSIVATWGNGPARWIYEVKYRDLGSTRAPAAPVDAQPLRGARRPPKNG